jgi:hypothetical protein
MLLSIANPNLAFRERDRHFGHRGINKIVFWLASGLTKASIVVRSIVYAP